MQALNDMKWKFEFGLLERIKEQVIFSQTSYVDKSQDEMIPILLSALGEDGDYQVKEAQLDDFSENYPTYDYCVEAEKERRKKHPIDPAAEKMMRYLLTHEPEPVSGSISGSTPQNEEQHFHRAPGKSLGTERIRLDSSLWTAETISAAPRQSRFKEFQIVMRS